ncbi:MAG: heme lyase CcmF/NrfE family subunit [Cellvibrionaceae bacterium]
MIAELGHFALILAFFLSLVLAIVPQLGAAQNNLLWMRTARPLSAGIFFFILLAFVALTQAFLDDDFSVKYVAGHSNTLLPVQYKISAVWGGHEGSLLLWILMLAGWTQAVAMSSSTLPLKMVARVLSVMGAIGTGFLSFMLLTSNPFDRFLPLGPEEGSDLNPLLQDPGLIFHPPILYMGYVGLSVVFAFAVAALIDGRLDSAWARWARPWTNVAWGFLTLGIALGSWWAYYELGWGGWWFWDPVENASLMPWLVATGLIHSLSVTEKRGAFKSWTLLLAIFAFSLSLLGTFLVRSGVLTSVHAFANDPERGVFILGFLTVVVGSALTLFALRAPAVKSVAKFSGLSRELFMLCNNILLVLLMAVVLLGTLYPLVVDALGWGKISVGPPYFNFFFAPISIVLLILLAPTAMLQWKNTQLSVLKQQLSPVLIVSVVVGFALPLLWDEYSFMLAVVLAAALWVVLASIKDLGYRLRHRGFNLKALSLLTPSYYGMLMAHIGVAIAMVGGAVVSIHSDQQDLRFKVGDAFSQGGYTFTLVQSQQVRGPNYIADQAEIHVTDEGSGKLISVLFPEKRQYKSGGNMMTEAAINSSFTRDIYVSLANKLGPQDWAVRVQVKPAMCWVWLGSILMALGGLIAILDKRYRKVKIKNKNPVEGVASSV